MCFQPFPQITTNTFTFSESTYLPVKTSKCKLSSHLLTATDLEVQLLVMMGINRGMCVCWKKTKQEQEEIFIQQFHRRKDHLLQPPELRIQILIVAQFSKTEPLDKVTLTDMDRFLMLKIFYNLSAKIPSTYTRFSSVMTLSSESRS